MDDVCIYHLNYVIPCCKRKVISTFTRHYVLSDVPDEGAVTLFYVPSIVDYYRGLLLVWLNDQWGTVSDSFWTIDDVKTVCRQLGRNGKIGSYTYESKVLCKNTGLGTSSYYYGYTGNLTVVMSNVQCVGTESRLIDCSYTSGGSGSPVSLECSSEGKQLDDIYFQF